MTVKYKIRTGVEGGYWHKNKKKRSVMPQNLQRGGGGLPDGPTKGIRKLYCVKWVMKTKKRAGAKKPRKKPRVRRTKRGGDRKRGPTHKEPPEGVWSTTPKPTLTTERKR